MSGEWSADGKSGVIGGEKPKPVAGSHGTIQATIGTGDNAKNSIVWMTITWSFITAFACVRYGAWLDGYCALRNLQAICLNH